MIAIHVGTFCWNFSHSQYYHCSLSGNEWLHWGFPPCGAKRHMDLMCTSRVSVQVKGTKQWRLHPLLEGTGLGNWTEVSSIPDLHLYNLYILVTWRLVTVWLLYLSVLGSSSIGGHPTAWRCSSLVPGLGARNEDSDWSIY